jgi:hypothetical protein
VVRRILPYIRQYETHRQLAGRARPGNWRVGRTDLDAIIVPASRSADNLDHAVTLAQDAQCWLVVLCSRETRATDVGQLFTDKRFTKGVAVDISDDYRHPLLAFSSSDLARGSESPVCVNPNGDLSTKRNLGLLLARMLGWSRIFFMDDDVRGVSLTDLRATVSMLDRYRSVGMRVTNYADNSVVCHAHRVTGANQDVFVSGSVLAVNCQEPFGFFPEIYNEDWLFFYDDARAGQLGWSGRDVTQLPYDPFEDVGRAERQEFGDVLAEGLYALLHVGSGIGDVTVGYWNKFMATRKNVLEQIIGRADSVAPEIGQNIVRAVQTAMLRLMQIQPKAFEDYIKAWRDDLRVWAERLEKVPRAGSLEEALEVLVLGSAQRGHPTVHEPAGAMPALQVMLDAAALVVYFTVSNLRYGRTAPVFARVRRRIQRTDPREAISSVLQAPKSEPDLALAQDPALAAAPVRVPRQLPDVVDSTFGWRHVAVVTPTNLSTPVGSANP